MKIRTILVFLMFATQLMPLPAYGQLASNVFVNDAKPDSAFIKAFARVCAETTDFSYLDTYKVYEAVAENLLSDNASVPSDVVLDTAIILARSYINESLFTDQASLYAPIARKYLSADEMAAFADFISEPTMLHAMKQYDVINRVYRLSWDIRHYISRCCSVAKKDVERLTELSPSCSPEFASLYMKMYSEANYQRMVDSLFTRQKHSLKPKVEKMVKEWVDYYFPIYRMNEVSRLLTYEELECIYRCRQNPDYHKYLSAVKEMRSSDMDYSVAMGEKFKSYLSAHTKLKVAERKVEAQVPKPKLDTAIANDSPSKTKKGKVVYPKFPGGEKGYRKWYYQNFEYPDRARRLGVEGCVYVQFNVLEDGSVTDIKIVERVSPELDAEALRLMKLMPKWTPGKNMEEGSKLQFVYPVNFELDKNGEPKRP